MRFSEAFSYTRGLQSVSNAVAEWFPTPQLLTPPAAGIDISDASVKWLVFARTGGTCRVLSYGEVSIPEGLVKNGVIQNISALAEVLAEVKGELGGITFAHA